MSGSHGSIAACGHCTPCISGWETLCAGQQNTGYSVNGGFAEYSSRTRLRGTPARQRVFVEIAPILCAGVTVYKGLKVTDTKPGDWVVISGIGGLGHVAVQYAIAMGRKVIRGGHRRCKARSRAQARSFPRRERAQSGPRLDSSRKEIGGAHGVLVTAVSPKAFQQALGMVRRGGTVYARASPPATSRSPSSTWCSTESRCAAPSSAPASTCRKRCSSPERETVKATVATERLENINQVFARMHAGDIQGRVVIDMGQ